MVRPAIGCAALIGAASTLFAARAPAQVAAAPDTATDVMVRGVRSAREVTSVRVGAEQAERLAGTEGDPVKAVEDLPGVARPSFGSGPIVLWGAPAGSSAILVDGVPIPTLFHGSSLRATVGADLVRDVTLTPGGFAPDYGRAMGGLLRIDTRDLDGQTWHARARADVVDGSAWASVPLGDRVRVAVGARYGWLDSALHALKVPDVDQYEAFPHYADGHAKAQIDLGPGEALDAVLLGSTDTLSSTVPGAAPSRVHSQMTRGSFERFYLHYRRLQGDGTSIDVVPWIGHDTSDLDDAFGGAPSSLYDEAWRAGLRASYRARVVPWASLTVGADLEADRDVLTRQGSLEIPPREGDISVFGQPPGPDMSTDAWNAGSLDLAPYAYLDLDAGPWTITPGLRFDGYVTTTSRSTPRVGQTPAIGDSRLDGVLEPRLSARLNVTRGLEVFASAGIYSQPAAASDRSAIFGNPELGPSTADHVIAGESLRVLPTLTAQVTGFYEWMSDLAVRSPLPTPKLSEALLQQGVGRSYGLQAMMCQSPREGFSGWVSYTISRSERRDALDGALRLFDGDQTHLLSIVANEALGAFSVGLRFRFASGLPRTPVIGAFYDVKDDLFDPLFGPQNSIRLPSFWELDARVDRSFELGRTARALLYLEVLDMTYHANAEEYVYSADYARRGTIRGLPLVVALGAKVER